MNTENSEEVINPEDMTNEDKIDLLIEEDDFVDARTNEMDSVIMSPPFYDGVEAFESWSGLYNTIACGSLVHLIPNKGEIEDQVYVKNLGVALAHTEDNIFIASKFHQKNKNDNLSLEHMKQFVTNLGFEIKQPRFKFSGEADLVYLRDNIYLGGYGNLTD